jgi:hypothetical protein
MTTALDPATIQTSVAGEPIAVDGSMYTDCAFLDAWSRSTSELARLGSLCGETTWSRSPGMPR